MRSPTPSAHSSRSGTPQPAALDSEATEHAMAVINNLGRQVFVVIFSVVFAIFYGMNETSFFSFIFKILMVGSTFYVLMFVFFDQGGRYIAETFCISFTIISLTYFLVQCRLRDFLVSLFVAAMLAIVSRLLN